MEHSDAINHWDSLAELARDIGLDSRTGAQAVYRWRTRNSIPGRFWIRVVESAERRGYPITLEDLAQAASENAA